MKQLLSKTARASHHRGSSALTVFRTMPASAGGGGRVKQAAKEAQRCISPLRYRFRSMSRDETRHKSERRPRKSQRQIEKERESRRQLRMPTTTYNDDDDDNNNTRPPAEHVFDSGATAAYSKQKARPCWVGCVTAVSALSSRGDELEPKTRQHDTITASLNFLNHIHANLPTNQHCFLQQYNTVKSSQQNAGKQSNLEKTRIILFAQ